MKIALYNRDPGNGIEALKQLLREKGATLACYGEDFFSWEGLPADTGLFLSLGGDGTFLQSLTFVRDRGIPVAGINFGRLGFLTTAQAADAARWADDLLAGRFHVEERSLSSGAESCNSACATAVPRGDSGRGRGSFTELTANPKFA